MIRENFCEFFYRATEQIGKRLLPGFGGTDCSFSTRILPVRYHVTIIRIISPQGHVKVVSTVYVNNCLVHSEGRRKIIWKRRPINQMVLTIQALHVGLH